MKRIATENQGSYRFVSNPNKSRLAASNNRPFLSKVQRHCRELFRCVRWRERYDKDRQIRSPVTRVGIVV